MFCTCVDVRHALQYVREASKRLHSQDTSWCCPHQGEEELFGRCRNMTSERCIDRHVFEFGEPSFNLTGEVSVSVLSHTTMSTFTHMQCNLQ